MRYENPDMNINASKQKGPKKPLLDTIEFNLKGE